MSRDEIVVQSEHLAAEASAWLAGRCRLVECGYDEERFRGVLADAVGLVGRDVGRDERAERALDAKTPGKSAFVVALRAGGGVARGAAGGMEDILAPGRVAAMVRKIAGGDGPRHGQQPEDNRSCRAKQA